MVGDAVVTFSAHPSTTGISRDNAYAPGAWEPCAEDFGGGQVIGIILAGGAATRLGGGDKGLLAVGGRPILDRVIETMRPQCEALVLAANGDLRRFTRFGCPVVADSMPDRPGPLAGLLAGLDHVAVAAPDRRFVVTVPWDAPFLPLDLVARLGDRRQEDRAAICRAASGERVHNVVALWSVALREELRRALLEEGLRKVGNFASRHPVATVNWPSVPFDPFLNVNTPEDLALAERIASTD